MTSTINVQRVDALQQVVGRDVDDARVEWKVITYVLTIFSVSSHVSAKLINVDDARPGWPDEKLHSAITPNRDDWVPKHTSEPSKVYKSQNQDVSDR